MNETKQAIKGAGDATEGRPEARDIHFLRLFISPYLDEKTEEFICNAAMEMNHALDEKIDKALADGVISTEA